MKCIVEEEWEANDIIDYCINQGIEIIEMSSEKINGLESFEFFNQIVFCNTVTVQRNLKNLDLYYIIPNTYPQEFNDLYHRNIIKVDLNKLYTLEYPYFIKSTGNMKVIDGTVIKNQDDFTDLWITNNVLPDSSMEFYVSDCVKFLSEKRVLLGNSKIYAIGHQFGSMDISIDDEFLNKIISLSNNKYYCVDIGYIQETGWSIVEVNPPFSLDDFDISIDVYVTYARNVWCYILNELKKMKSKSLDS
jgi:hypothetical protein